MAFQSLSCVGAASELRVSADLLEKGYYVFRSVSSTCPFDLLAYDQEEEKVYRIEVKTGTRNVTGQPTPNRKQFKRSWNTKVKFDVLSVYLKSDGTIQHIEIEPTKGEELKVI